jgi:glycosyltransferase involved in cell wall biosynthesis
MICSDLGYPHVGGGEQYVIELASKLAKLGHDVHWLTSRLPYTSFYEVYKGINIHRISIPFSKHYIFPGRQLFPLAGLLPTIELAKKMDIIQFNTFVAGTFGWFIAKITKKPTVLFCHEMFNELWGLIGQNYFEKIIYPLIEEYIAHSSYDWFLVPSKYSKKTLVKAGAPKEKITVIPHGIDFNLFNPYVSGMLRERYGLENKKVVGFTGRLSIKGTGQSKNLLILLSAMKYVVKEIPEAVLALGGSGFEQVKPYIDKEIFNHIVYTGQRPYDEVPKFIASCDLIVCPALADGFCFLLAEASACGKPVVATKRASHVERVIDKKTGVLTGNSEKELAEGICKLLSDEKLMKKYGKNGAKYAKRLSWESSVKKHLEVYKKLLG